MVKTPNGSMESYVFNTNECCMNSCYFSDEEGKLYETVIKEKRPEAVLMESMKEEHNKYFVMRENEIQTSHRIKQTKNYVIKEGEIEMSC